MKEQISTTGQDSSRQSLTHRRFWRQRPSNRLFALFLSGLLVFLAFPVIWLVTYGERFFSLTYPVPPEVLVVEGWVGQLGIEAAAAEFIRGGYKYVVVTGGQTGDLQIAGQELARLNVAKDRIIIAASGEIQHQRTFNSAIDAWRALQNRSIRPQYANVLTLGPHSRRSYLVYSKVFAPSTKVGVIAWVPADYGSPWWQSMKRTKCLFKEIVGYPFELLLNSGRVSNSPG